MNNDETEFLPYTPLMSSSLAAQMQHLGDNDPESTLGADLAEIRKRVLGDRTDATNLSPEEHKELYDVVKQQYQVDLNEEAAAAGLEDPSLMAHIEGARRRLAEHERHLLRLPRLEELRSNYLKTMRKMSDLLRSLEDQHMAERENVELGHRQGRIIEDLLDGGRPHGFQSLGLSARSDPVVRENLTLLSAKSKNLAASYETLLEFVEGSRQALFVLRRDVETVADGLIDLVEAAEEDRRRLREFLMVASRTPAAKGATDPSGTLGEKILADPRLPEKTGLKATEDES